MSIAKYSDWHKLWEAQTTFDELPPDLQEVLSSAKDLAEKILMKDAYSDRMRVLNMYIYVKDRESDSDKIFKALKQEKRNPKIVKMHSLSSFPQTEFTYEGNKTVRLVYKPLGGGGQHETTLNSTITELVPTLLFNSGQSVSSDPGSMMKIIREYYASKPEGILSPDMKAADEFIEMFESSTKFDKKMYNAYEIYSWLKDYDSNVQKIDKIYWAYRTKPQGVPPKSSADIVIKHKNNKIGMLGVSLKAGIASSSEPILNSSVMNCVSAIAPNMQNAIMENAWNIAYSSIVDLYNTESGNIVDITKDNFYVYNDKNASSSDMFTVLEWYEKYDSNAYKQKYYEIQEYLRDTIADLISDNQEEFRQYMMDKMGLSGSFPLIILKATGKGVEEVKGSSKEKMLQILQTEDLNFVKHPGDKSLIQHTLKDGKIMTFQIRSKSTGVKHMLGEYYNQAFMFKGVK